MSFSEESAADSESSLRTKGERRNMTRATLSDDWHYIKPVFCDNFVTWGTSRHRPLGEPSVRDPI